MPHDVIVIGSEEDAIAASVVAANAGLDVLLVDGDERAGARNFAPGPLLLSLLHQTVLEIHAAHRVLGRERTASELRALFGRILARSRDDAVGFHCASVRERLSDAKVGVAPGRPRMLSPTEVEIAPGDVRSAPIFIVAAGARARRPTCFPFDDRIVCDSDSILLGNSVPRNLVVVGADIVGCEFSCMFAALGTQVTLVERRRRLLRFVDADLREVLHEWLQRTGVTVVMDEGVADVRRVGSGVAAHAIVTLGSGRIEVSDRVLIAAGGVPNTRGLDLDRARVDVDSRGFVTVDEHGRTSQPGIWATGRVVDALAPVGVLRHQGRTAMLDAMGARSEANVEIPLVIHTVPQIATVGLSQEACEHLDLGCFAVTASLGRELRARIRGEGEGLLKLVVHAETLQVLGVHVVGMSAHEIVNLGSALLRRGCSLEDLATTSFSEGSLSAAYQSAALEALRRRAPSSAARAAREDLDVGKW